MKRRPRGRRRGNPLRRPGQFTHCAPRAPQLVSRTIKSQHMLHKNGKCFQKSEMNDGQLRLQECSRSTRSHQRLSWHGGLPSKFKTLRPKPRPRGRPGGWTQSKKEGRGKAVTMQKSWWGAEAEAGPSRRPTGKVVLGSWGHSPPSMPHSPPHFVGEP